MMALPLQSDAITRPLLQERFSFRYVEGKAFQKTLVACCPTRRKSSHLHLVRCSGEDSVGGPIQHPQYHSYVDPITGEPAPAYGTDRTNLPDMAFWAEDMPGIKRKAQASTPSKTSNQDSVSSTRKAQRGGRRRQTTDPGESKDYGGKSVEGSNFLEEEEEEEDEEEEDEFRDEYVTYEPDEQEREKESADGTSLALVRQHETDTQEPLPNEELWWNWRKPAEDKQPWSAWHKRPGDSDSVMAAAMNETGQIKLFGEKPSVAEATLARARKYVFYKERLSMEEQRRKEIGSVAYYKEWVKAWRKDTSKEAVQKHAEETGEDVSTQLLNMFEHQTSAEYRYMMGTDIRIQRDPLTMRMRKDQIKQVWGGDPVYPTINYRQDPDAIVDYRGPNFHEPTRSILESLEKAGRLVSREEIKRIQEEEAAEDLELESSFDDAIAGAVDIGEKEEEEEEEEEGAHPWRAKKPSNLEGQVLNLEGQVLKQEYGKGEEQAEDISNQEDSEEEKEEETEQQLPTAEKKANSPSTQSNSVGKSNLNLFDESDE